MRVTALGTRERARTSSWLLGTRTSSRLDPVEVASALARDETREQLGEERGLCILMRMQWAAAVRSRLSRTRYSRPPSAVSCNAQGKECLADDRFLTVRPRAAAIALATFRSPDPARTTPRGTSTTAQDDASGVGRPSACSWGGRRRAGRWLGRSRGRDAVSGLRRMDGGPGGSIAVGGPPREGAIPLPFHAVRRARQSVRRSFFRRQSGCCPARLWRSTRPSLRRRSWCRRRRPIRSRSRSSSWG